jgi:pimeloyl-ACP methyl ester carboxylesterase
MWKPAAMETLTRDGLVFDITSAGPADGETVLLLHGFPQHSDCWDRLVPLLTAAGYRAVTVDQRGYTPRASPRRRRDYKAPDLAADVAAVIDACGGRVHLVGHDWGAAVAWAVAAAYPEKVAGLTALSVAHPRAFLTALVTSRQILSSWYMLFFQLPRLPERLFHARLESILTRGGQSAGAARRDAAGFPAPSDLTGPMNYYRALPLVNVWARAVKITRPTLFVWSDGDQYLTRYGAERCGDHVSGPYQYAVLPGVSHWIPDEAPHELAALLLPHLERWSAVPAEHAATRSR